MDPTYIQCNHLLREGNLQVRDFSDLFSDNKSLCSPCKLSHWGKRQFGSVLACPVRLAEPWVYQMDLMKMGNVTPVSLGGQMLC